MSLIERFLTNEYVVVRKKVGYYSKGRYVDGDEETVTIRGSLQVQDGEGLEMKSEGFRLSQTWKFYSEAPLLVLGTNPTKDSNRVVIDGETYRVINENSWHGVMVDLPHYKYTLLREPQQ